MRNNERVREREGNYSHTDVAQLKDLGAQRRRNAALVGEVAVIQTLRRGTLRETRHWWENSPNRKRAARRQKQQGRSNLGWQQGPSLWLQISSLTWRRHKKCDWRWIFLISWKVCRIIPNNPNWTFPLQECHGPTWGRKRTLLRAKSFTQVIPQASLLFFKVAAQHSCQVQRDDDATTRRRGLHCASSVVPRCDSGQERSACRIFGQNICPESG